jgi:hypothetical protein
MNDDAMCDGPTFPKQRVQNIDSGFLCILSILPMYYDKLAKANNTAHSASSSSYFFRPHIEDEDEDER